MFANNKPFSAKQFKFWSLSSSKLIWYVSERQFLASCFTTYNPLKCCNQIVQSGFAKAFFKPLNEGNSGFTTQSSPGNRSKSCPFHKERKLNLCGCKQVKQVCGEHRMSCCLDEEAALLHRELHACLIVRLQIDHQWLLRWAILNPSRSHTVPGIYMFLYICLYF